MYKIKNMTFSPLRIVMNGEDVRLLPRNYTYLEKINSDIRQLERQKLIKIREVK
jgi:hypothetical protein